MRKSNVRKTIKFKRSIKAISPVIATLLMIAIAVVASLVVYAWVTGYIGGSTEKAGKAIAIPSFALDDSGKLHVYVQNVGQGTTQLSAVYVNNELKLSPGDVVPEGNTVELVIDGPYDTNTNLNIKVTTNEGTFMTTNGKPKSGPTSTSGPTSVLDHFTFDNIPAQTPNVAFGITIRAMDQFNSPYTSYTGTNTLTSTGSIAPTSTTAFVAGVWTGQVKFSTPIASASISTLGDGITGVSNFFDVSNAAAVLDHFAFDTISSSQTTGTGFSITIKAIDQYGAEFTSYTGTNTLSYSGGTINPTTTGSFTAGVWSGSVTLTGTGTGITLGTTGSTKTGTSNTFNVNTPASILDHFIFATISSPQTAGTGFSITITAKDASGATVTSYSGTNTLTVSTGTLSPTATTAFTAGVWTGSVTLTQSGAGISISTSGSNKAGTSNTFTVNPGAATSFVVSGFTSPVTAGTAGSVTVTAKDANGNTATGYRGTVHFISSDIQATLPSNYAFTSGDNGVHTFTNGVTLKVVGSQSITATDSVTSSITGSQTPITVNPAVASKIVFTAHPSTVVHGQVTTVFTVQRQDQFGNPTTSGTTTIDLSASTSSCVFYSNSGGTQSITSLSIASGSSSGNFYWKYTGNNYQTRTINADDHAGTLTHGTTTIIVT